MNGEQVWLSVAAGGAVALVLLVVACALLWRRAGQLAARLDEVETRLEERHMPTTTDAPSAHETSSYVITGLPDDDETAEDEVHVGRIDGALFADIVARETTIKAVGLAHGLRRALSAQSRNRIRFEMKQQVRRSRKQRRADLRAALRDFQTREDAA